MTAKRLRWDRELGGYFPVPDRPAIREAGQREAARELARARTSRLEWSGGAAGPVLKTFSDDGADWRDSALCRQADPELFFPPDDEAEQSWSADEAKQVCRLCPSRAACLDYALTQPAHVQGVWGGLSERQRRTLRLKRQAA